MHDLVPGRPHDDSSIPIALAVRAVWIVIAAVGVCYAAPLWGGPSLSFVDAAASVVAVWATIRAVA